MKQLGQITIPLALALSGATGIVTGLTFYFGGQIAQNDKLAETNKQVAILQTEKENITSNMARVETKVDNINDKLDALLVNRGLNPDKIENAK